MPYPDSMLRWRLKETMDAQGITRYALQKETGISMNTIRGMYDGTNTRTDFPLVDKVILALRKMTGEEIGLQDVLEWKEG